MTKLVEILRNANYVALGWVAVQAVLLAGAWWYVRRKGKISDAAAVVLSILTLRFVLFSTPFSWGLYFVALRDHFNDHRDQTIVVERIKSFLDKGSPYLAIGSSQTHAVYKEYAHAHGDLDYFHLAGMTPFDYWLEYDRLVAKHPGTMLLYMSEFDLARPISAPASRTSSLELWHLPELYRLARAAAGEELARQLVLEKLIAELFPEHKYAFIATAFGKRLTGAPRPAAEVEKAPLENHLKNLAKLNADNVPVQSVFLHAFLKRAEEDGIPVVIVEGQYHPKGYSPKNASIRKDRVEPLLAALPQRYPNVKFLPVTETLVFSEQDYSDGYHVKPASGLAFVQALLPKLMQSALSTGSLRSSPR